MFDIMKVSKEEALMLECEKDIDLAARKIMDFGPKILLITDGANGVTYYCHGNKGFIPSLRVKAVDTTGAGDIFFGTFIYELLKYGKSLNEIKTEDIERYIEMAVRTSGLSTKKTGAITSIPEYEEALNL